MLLLTMFGRNIVQQNRFLALVSNQELFLENLDVALNSTDVGTIQALESLDSLDSKINQMQVAYQQFYTTIGAEDVWKRLVDGATNAINTLNSLPKAFDKVPTGAIAMIANVIGLIKFGLRSGASEIAKVLQEVMHTAGAQTQVVAKEAGQKVGQAMADGVSGTLSKWQLPNLKDKIKENWADAVSVIGQSLTTIGLMMDKTTESGQMMAGVFTGAGGIAQIVSGFSKGLLGIPEILTGILNLINGIDLGIENSEEKLERLTKEAQQLNDEAKVAKAEYNSLQRTADKLDELKAKRYESAEAEQAYEDAVESLASKMPALIDGTDELGVVSVNTGNMEKELARLREQTAEKTLEAIEAEKQQNQQDLENAKEKQRERIESLNDSITLDTLSSTKDYSNVIFTNMLEYIWQNFDGLDESGLEWNEQLKQVIIKDEKIFNDYIKNRENKINSLGLSEEAINSLSDPKNIVSNKIKQLSLIKDDEEKFNKLLLEIVTLIEENGLQSVFDLYLEYSGELNKGAQEIKEKTDKLAATEKTEFSLILQKYIKAEDDFFNSLKSGETFLSYYLNARADEWLASSKNEGKGYNDYFIDRSFDEDYNDFQDAVKKMAESIGVEFSEIWDNLEKYTLNDFKKILGENDPVYKTFAEYYNKYIPDYINKLSMEIIPFTFKDDKFDDRKLMGLRVQIRKSKDIITKDLYTWISNTLELAQDYANQGFTTAGNNILSGLTDIVTLLNSEGFDPNIRIQIIEALKNTNMNTTEGITSLIQTLEELGFTSDSGIIQALQEIAVQLRYNVSLALQSYVDGIAAGAEDFSKAMEGISKGYDPSEAMNIIKQISADGKGEVKLTDLANFEGKFFLKNDELIKRYVNKKKEDLTSSFEQIRANAEMSLEGINEDKEISTITKEDLEGYREKTLQFTEANEKYFANILEPYGFAKKVIDERTGEVKGFELNVDAILDAWTTTEKYFGDFSNNFVHARIKEAEEIGEAITNHDVSQTFLDNGMLEAFFNSLEGFNPFDAWMATIFTKQGNIEALLRIYGSRLQGFGSALEEKYFNAEEQVYDDIIQAIEQDTTVKVTDANREKLAKMAKDGFAEAAEKNGDEVLSYFVDTSKKGIEYISQGIYSSNMSDEKVGEKTEQLHKAVDDGSQEIIDALFENSNKISESYYIQLRRKIEATGEKADWGSLFTKNDDGTLSFTGTVETIKGWAKTLSVNVDKRVAESEKERLETIGNELDKQIGEEVSKETADFLNQFDDFKVVRDGSGKWIIQSLGDLTTAHQAYYDELAAEYGEDAEIVKQERAKIIELHDSSKQKALDAINSIMDATGGDWLDITDFTSELSEEQSDKLEGALKKFGIQIEKGIMQIPEGANIIGIQKEILRTAQSSGQFLDSELKELADAVAETISKYADLISNAISGGISNADAATLQSFASANGLGKLDFRATTEGLQLAQNSAIQLYQTIKQIDDIQGQIVFKELSDSLVKNNAEYQDMTSLLAHIKELNQEINSLPVGSERRQEYERELQVAKEIKETRAMTDPDYFNFMDADLPDPMKGAENYWNSVNKAFTVMNQAADTGYMSLTDFRNLVNHMNDVAQQTGQTTEFMGYTLDGSLESASALIQKGFSAIKNVDGQGAVVNLKALGNNFADGAASMQIGMQRGAKSMAKANIKMLDAMIQQLELIVAMEEFSNLDPDKDNEINMENLFPHFGTDDSDWYKKMSKEGKQDIENLFKLAEDNKDLEAALDKFKINGESMRDMMKRAADGNLKSEGEAKVFYATLQAFYKALKTGDFSQETIKSETVRIIQETLGEDEWVNYTLTDGTQVVINHEGSIEKTEKGWTYNGETYDSLDKAIEAAKYSEEIAEFEKETGAKFTRKSKKYKDSYYGEIDLTSDYKIQVYKNLKTGKTLYKVEDKNSGELTKETFNSQEEAIDYIYKQAQESRVEQRLGEQTKEEWMIENDVAVNAKMNVKSVSATLDKTPDELSDEMLEQLGIDTKLVGAIEVGIERALSGFDLMTAVKSVISNGIKKDENGKVVEDNNAFNEIGREIGEGAAGAITAAIVDALNEYYNPGGQGQTDIQQSIEDGVANAAEGANPEISEINTTVKQANVDKVGFVKIEEGSLPVDGEGNNTTLDSVNTKIASLKTGQVGKVNVDKSSLPVIDENGNNATLDSANSKVTTLTIDPTKAKIKEGETLEIGDASATADKVDVTSATEASLNETVKANVEAQVGTVDVSSIETAQQTVTTSVTNASTSMSTLGGNIDTAKGKVDNLAASLNAIENTGASEASKFKTALNAIGEKGSTNTENFKKAINAIEPSGPNRTKDFKEAANAIASYAPTYAENFVKAVNSIKDKTFKVTGSVNVTVSTSGAVSATVSSNTSIAKGNIALAGGKKNTLMGELGPELYVTNGHYYIAGQNGAEMVDLPDDAIVFNHLQTERLLKSGKGGRGKPVKSEAAAVAQATGNVALAQGKPLGPAMASSAREALALLKELRAMWQSLLNASSKQLGIQSGKSDKGNKNDSNASDGGKSSNEPGTKDNNRGKDLVDFINSPGDTSSTDKIADNVDDIANEVHSAKIGHVVHTIQDLYNELREIESLTRKIEYQSNLQKMFENDRYNNGKQIGESIGKQYELLGNLLESQKATYTKESELLQQDIANYEATPYGQFYEVIDDKVVATGFDTLSEIFKEDSTGAGVGDAESYKKQVQGLLNLGIRWEDMIWDLGGNKAVATYSGLDEMYDENGKQLDESQMSQVWQTMVQNSMARLDNYRDGIQERLDSLNDRENEIVDIVSQRNDILNYMIDLQMELENEVLEAIEDQNQTVIENSQKERDAYEEASKTYIDGLNKSLQREREMYQAQQDTDELTKLQRQLEILQRTGGSGSQIQSLINQIQSKQQDMYFSQKENEINAIQEASNKQLEKMDKEIDLMTETLEFEKEHGLLWKEVDALMAKGTDEVVNFIAGNKKEWASKSTLAQTTDINKLSEKFDTLEELKNIPTIVNDAMIKVKDNLEAMVNKAAGVEANEDYDNNGQVDPVPESGKQEIGGTDNMGGGGSNGSSSSSSSDSNKPVRKNDYIDFLTKYGLSSSNAKKNILSKINLPNSAKTYDYTSTIGKTNKEYTASFEDGKIVINTTNPYEKLTDSELKEAKKAYINYNKERYVTDIANKYGRLLGKDVSEEDINYDAFKDEDEIAAFKQIRKTTQMHDFTSDYTRNGQKGTHYYGKGIDYVSIPDNYARLEETIPAKYSKIIEYFSTAKTAPVDGKKKDYYVYIRDSEDANSWADQMIKELSDPWNPGLTKFKESLIEEVLEYLTYYRKGSGFNKAIGRTHIKSKDFNFNPNGIFLGSYAEGGYVGQLQKIATKNGDDGLTINSLKQGEAVLTPEQAYHFSRLVDYLPELNKLLEQTEYLREEMMNNFINRLNNYSIIENYQQMIESAFDKINTIKDNSNLEQFGVNIEKFELTMNAKISDNYSAEQAGEAVFNKMVQMARKSGNYNGITRR